MLPIQFNLERPGRRTSQSAFLRGFIEPCSFALTLSASAVAQDPAPPAQTAPPASEPAPPPPAPAAAGTPEADLERQKLEAEFRQALSAEQPQSQPPPSAPAPTAASSLRLIDLAFDLLGVGGTSTAPEPELRSLEAGGHDPKNRGFTLQNAELTLAGVVDPYLRGDTNIVLQIDESGETVVELEEAYLSTLDLPFHLQLKAGQFLSAFGRLNPTHPHTWNFVDQPVINSRLFGPDGLRSQGVQLAWLTPLPFFAELVLSVQNAHGETATSFRNVPGETLAGRTLIERDVQSIADLLYLARLSTSFDVSEEITLVPGVSAVFGPNASGPRSHTQIYGFDLYVRWKPLVNEQGWPFVAWQTEGMYRNYRAGAVLDAGGIPVRGETTLDDIGFYSQLVWGFSRPWVAGVRYDQAKGETDSFTLPELEYSSAGDPLRDERQRYSAMLTYYPSEFSKVRIQYNYDHAQFLGEGSAQSAYLQFEILFGAHGAHKF